MMMLARQSLPRLRQATRQLSSTSRVQAAAGEIKMISLEVDGVEVQVPQGSALIQACEQAGESIGSR